MPSKYATLRAEESIQATLAMADRIVSLDDKDGHAAARELVSVLQAADKEVAKRLLKISPKPNGELRFAAAQAIAMRTQLQLVVHKTQARLEPVITEPAKAAMGKSLKEGVKTLAQLEHDFKGVSVSPNILAAMQQSQILRGPSASLVTRVATSLDRYGLHMGQEFARIIQVGLASGATNDQMVAALVAHGGPKGIVSLAAKEIAPGIVQRIREGNIPEGLFVRNKYWAERIIRTEVAFAFSGAKLEQLRQMRAEGLDVQKKICAHFDNRTAPDSIYVHGQIRALDESFIDGMGRVYLHPPGRPNDRETILPWFSDWTETPSTKPPNPDEQQLAEALSHPQPPAAPLVPRSTEELHQLEQEAAAMHAQVREEQAGRAALELGHEAEAHAHAETLAGEVLKKIEADKLQKQIALKKAVEEQLALQQALAQKKQASADQKFFKKLDGEIKALVQAGGAADAHLKLIALAHDKPEPFSKFVLATKSLPTPPKALAEVVNKAHELLTSLVKDTLSNYTAFAPGQLPATEALEAFKKGPGFEPYVKSLTDTLHDKQAKSADKKEAKALLTALVQSEGHNWAEAHKEVTKNPLLAGKTLLKKYPPPAAPATAQLEPKPKLTIQIEVGYHDVYVEKNGVPVKIAYFKEVGGQYVVTPPTKLKGFEQKSFVTQDEAAAYAYDVGRALQVLPSDPTKTSRFNHKKGTAPETVFKPVEIDPKAQAEIRQLRKIAAPTFAGGVTLNKEDELAQLDKLLEHKGLYRQQRKWSGDPTGCWYSSSDGPKSFAGKIIAYDNEKEILELARKMAHQVEAVDGDEDAKRYRDYCRLKYAATQEALQKRREVAPPIAHHSGDLLIDEHGYVTLYRGIKNEQAQHLRKIRETGAEVDVAFRSVASWTVSRQAAHNFSGDAGVIVRARIHVSKIFSQYQQEHIAMRRFGHGEAEWIVICEAKSGTMRMKAEDIQNPKDE